MTQTAPCKLLNHRHTIYASYIGYIVQAIGNNFAPLLFLTFASTYGLALDRITLLVTINFMVQLGVDLICAKAIDKMGYRMSMTLAHLFSALGLISMAILPNVLPDPYVGLLCAVVMYAIGGGILEVCVSPIVEACPSDNKEAAMSLLHSFYCWGHVGVVLISTAFFYFFGVERWPILSVLWALVPLFNLFYFQRVPIESITGGHEPLSLGKLFKQKVFWILIVLMVCAGASEQGMSQWASAFAEKGLGVSKTVGDLMGPCLFAVFMGTARALYGKFSEKLPLRPAMAACSILCIGCYLLASLTNLPVLGLVGCALCGFSVGIFWPGTFSIAALKLPTGGTAMYAFLALAGDLGCSSGPTTVGMVANAASGDLKTGLLAAIIFPVMMLIGLILLKDHKKAE